jgi:hypothetical protein
MTAFAKTSIKTPARIMKRFFDISKRYFCCAFGLEIKSIHHGHTEARRKAKKQKSKALFRCSTARNVRSF